MYRIFISNKFWTGNQDAAISYLPSLGGVRELSILSISSTTEERVGSLFLSVGGSGMELMALVLMWLLGSFLGDGTGKIGKFLLASPAPCGGDCQ